jgi:uncharacterized membrane protein
MSDLETELLFLANAGFAIAADATINPTAAIASIAKIVVFAVFIMFFLQSNDILELINPLLNLVK